MAPLVLALRADARFHPVLISTAQHGELLDQALGAFGLAPDIELEVSASRENLESFLGAALEPLGRVFGELEPTMTLVQGDTISVLAAAQASFLRRVPVGHVEAGLRTYDMAQPFPEEATRRMVSVVAAMHFAPTARARENLLREGVAAETIWVTGNTGVDALRRLRFATSANAQVRAIDFDAARVILVTAHRRENQGEPMAQICAAVKAIVSRFADVQVVVPVHANPAVRSAMHAELEGIERVLLLPPLDYSDLVYLMRRSTLLLTDSGGMQEEAPSCNCPVLILRNVTERPEVVDVGAGMLVGTEPAHIVEAVTSLLEDDDAYSAMALAPNPFGDGHASERIVGIIASRFERRTAREHVVGRVARAAALLFVLAFRGSIAHAQQGSRGAVETAASASSVGNGYGDWSSLAVRASWQASERTVLFPEIATSREFHDSGTLFALGATHTLSDRWFASGAVSTSSGGFYLPRARGTAVINRRVLADQRLVFNAGLSYARWKDAHSDIGTSVGGAYYFTAPFILELGTNRNFSRPGNVGSQSYFAAVTEGRANSHYLILRASGGREAYEVLAPGQVITDFASHSVSLSWRQWVSHGAGVVVGADHYANQFYGRTGVTLGGFWTIE